MVGNESQSKPTDGAPKEPTNSDEAKLEAIAKRLLSTPPEKRKPKAAS